MSLHFILTSLFIVVCVHAQLQQPLHAPGDGTDFSLPNPRPQDRTGRSSLKGHAYPDGGQLNRPAAPLFSPAEGPNQPYGPKAQLDKPSHAEVNAHSSLTSVSGQTRNEPSTDIKSPRLKSLYSSVQHLLKAKSSEENMEQSLLHPASRLEQEAFSKPRLYPSVRSSASSEDSAFYFYDDAEKALDGTSDNNLELNPAIVTEVPKPVSDSNKYTISSTDQESATLSSLLKDTFLERNHPAMVPGYLAERNSPQSDRVDSIRELDNGTPSLTQQQQPSLVSKREKEKITSEELQPRETQQFGQNDTALSVQERSWRCTVPDVHLGNGALPWSCHQRWAWRFLGEHVYPSRVYEVVCEGRTCWYGHFNCTPITYTLHVLEVCLHGCHDQRVPFPLRSLWQWTDLNVTVGCQCVR